MRSGGSSHTNSRLTFWFCLFNFEVEIDKVAVIVDVFVLVEPAAMQAFAGVKQDEISSTRVGYPGEAAACVAEVAIEIVHFWVIVRVVPFVEKPDDKIGSPRHNKVYGRETKTSDCLKHIFLKLCEIRDAYRLVMHAIQRNAVALAEENLRI